MHKLIPLLIFLSLSACGGGGSDAVETAVTDAATKQAEEAATAAAAAAVGSSGKTYGYIASAGSTGLAISGSIVGSAETLNASDSITVTVHKEWIQDVNGNPLDANYSYTFTTGS